MALKAVVPSYSDVKWCVKVYVTAVRRATIVEDSFCDFVFAIDECVAWNEC